MCTNLKGNSDNIKVAGRKGRWYVIAVHYHNGNKIFILEHETYGDLAECIIVDEKAREITSYKLREKYLW